MDNNEKAIVRTLLYSDVFDYPLSEDEVWKFLISDKNINKRLFESKVKKINSIVFRKEGLLYIEKKELAVSKRIEKFTHSQKKINIAYKTIKKLFIIPSVLFVGISGNLSMMNAEKKDDIDLFVVSKKDTVWITRLLLIIYLKILGKHRKRTDRNVSDKICLNMIVDEENLSLPKNLRNLYTAHEVAQLRPVMQRGNIYQKFINSNEWIKKYMPNVIRESESQGIEESRKSLPKVLSELILRFTFLENLAKLFQRMLIKRNLTREIIEDKIIALHPKDYKSIILAQYRERIAKYGL
ncbi:MAG: hypothetical protein AAB521_02485 [Patescibacteria group bacterium]